MEGSGPSSGARDPEDCYAVTERSVIDKAMAATSSLIRRRL
jgi:hypothetical protein